MGAKPARGLLLGVSALLLILSVTDAVRAQAVSTVCTFTAGPRAGTSYDYAIIGWRPLPVGSPCLDGAGSTGYVGGYATPSRGISTVCYFTAGPRAGTAFDYRATWQPLPVGTPCLDGMGSTGIVR
jgi:hypothetical protein